MAESPPPSFPAAPVPQPFSESDESAPRDASHPPEGRRFNWRVNIALFAFTLPSVFIAGAMLNPPSTGFESPVDVVRAGVPFAVPLLAILLAHEFGHYIAARLHRVPASLPYFLPLPLLSPFGTLGAVIAMPDRIRSRNALLDIGAAGPLAGMVVALPVIYVGLTLSPVGPSPISGYWQEGQSLLYWFMKWITVGHIPAGHDVQLHPTAFAGWAGFFITMLNLLPWGQLDGGHIAYALLGERQNKLMRWVFWALPLLFLYNVADFMFPLSEARKAMALDDAVIRSLHWLVLLAVLGGLARLSGGSAHPPTEPGELSPARKAVGWGCFVLLLLLFMPTPLVAY